MALLRFFEEEIRKILDKRASEKGGKMPIVKFNQSEEFIKELEGDAKVDRNIVRLTYLQRQSPTFPMIKQISVIVAYSVNGQIVCLEQHCGDVIDRDGVCTAIKEACNRLGLEVRGGSLEE